MNVRRQEIVAAEALVRALANPHQPAIASKSRTYERSADALEEPIDFDQPAPSPYPARPRVGERAKARRHAMSPSYERSASEMGHALIKFQPEGDPHVH